MSNTEKLTLSLREIAGEANVIDDPEKLKEYAVDGKVPGAVVSPGSIEASSKILAYAHAKKLTVMPRGKGTKMTMGNPPAREIDIVISSLRLNKVTDYDTGNLTLSAQSGLTLGEVQEMLAKEGKGYFLPMDPPFTEGATLGGIVAVNASGPSRYLYGSARDLILGIKLVSPDGYIVVSGGKVVKNVTGYDMNKLHIGALGTLGFICEVTFRLLPLPEEAATLLIPFKTLDKAGSFIREMVHSSYIPSFIEIIDGASASKFSSALNVTDGNGYVVAVGLEGVSEAVERQVSDIGNMGKERGAVEAITLKGEGRDSFAKALRDYSLYLNKDYPNLIVLKSNFTISGFMEMIEKSERLAEKAGFTVANVCHAGNGILYSYLLIGDEFESKVGAAAEMIEKLREEAVKFSGGLVVESTPTLLKEKVSVWGGMRGDYAVMRSLKDTIDPKGIFCPGRFVESI
ncbi:MAG: FAD-binding oxidoreductase [Syntrophaceae bacterium]|nr:FAD-binding oxidoreductase [Syntrophaceae bacterium]